MCIRDSTHTHTHTRLTNLDFTEARGSERQWHQLGRMQVAPHHLVFYTSDALPAAQPSASKHWRHNRLHKNIKINIKRNVSRSRRKYVYYCLRKNIRTLDYDGIHAVMYRCESWLTADKHELDVVRNNGFRHIFNCCWRESVKSLLSIYAVVITDWGKTADVFSR